MAAANWLNVLKWYRRFVFSQLSLQIRDRLLIALQWLNMSTWPGSMAKGQAEGPCPASIPNRGASVISYFGSALLGGYSE